MAQTPQPRHVVLPFSSVEIIDCELDPLYTWDFQNLAAPYWRYYYHDRCGAVVEFEGRTVEMVPHRPVLIPPYTAFSSRVSGGPDRVVRQFYIHFLVPEAPWRIAPGIYVVDVPSDGGATLRRVAERIAGRTPAPGFAFWAVHVVAEALSRLPVGAWSERSFDARIEAVLDVLSRAVGQDVDNETLADAASMSVRSLSRLFAAQVGTSPRQYLIARRLEEAAVMLQYADRTIDQIAEECGFNERSYFTRVFTKRWNLPPAAFRAAARRSVRSGGPALLPSGIGASVVPRRGRRTPGA